MNLLLIIVLVILFTYSWTNIRDTVKAAPPPNTPYEGSGNSINVFDFARNDSSLFTDGVNGTSFSYLASWFPSGYRGYQLQARVSELRRTEDPVPNGDFDQFDEPGNNWTLTESTGGLVKSVDNVTGGNPGSCLDIELKYGNVPNFAHAYIDNVFTFTSAISPDSLELSFDVRYSADISSATWLLVKVAVIYQASEVGSWSNTTSEYHPTSWDGNIFNTAAVNGTVTLRITIQKQGGGNANVKGHIYFDNFRYIIGTDSRPSEVGLQLNGNDVVDAIAPNNAGAVDIYADPTDQEEAPLLDCWTTTQTFQFTSPLYSDISFDYEYSMYIKSDSDTDAQTTFTAPVDQAPEWEINYTIPMGRPPSGHTGYSYGLFLRNGWSLIKVTDSMGQTITNYTFNPTSLFVKLDEDVSSVGDTFPIYASSLNYILEIFPQRSDNAGGPWENVSSNEYFVKDDFIRVLAQLRPFDAGGNIANVSIFFPNRSLWRSDASPIFDSGQNTLVSTVWQIPILSIDSAGSDWLITISYNNGTQCGMRQQAFTAVIETTGDKKSPITDQRVIWGDTVFVNATWQNQDTGAYITDAYARIRYIDRNLQVRYVDMIPNGQGAYSLDLATNLMSPDRSAEFYVEFYHYGYVNVTGTQLTFTINLVNDINYVMINPTQNTGPDEYTGDTTSEEGYTSQVRFYDPYQATYVRNDSSVWRDNVRLNYTRYDDSGSGWYYFSTGSFYPNASTPTIFEKYELYPGVQRIKYEVTMRIVDAGWDFEQQNFTIIIRIVETATDLDAYRTVIVYPPSGDGWTQYNNNTDTYEVRIYWNEVFNVTVFYHFAENDTGIESATAKILIGPSLYTMSDETGGYYNYQLDTSSIGIGTTDLFVNATYPSYAAQTIQIRLIVEARKTELTKDVIGSVVDLPYDDDFVVTFTFRDTVTGSPIPITDATQSIVGYPTNYTINNNYDGTYTITFWGNITETTYYVTISFSRTNYTSKSQYFEITVRPIHTTAFGQAESVSIPWGTNLTINLAFNDTDHGYLPITGAGISFLSTDGFFNSSQDVYGIDYWLLNNPDGSYTLILSTWRVDSGLQPFTLTVTLTRNHYDASQVFVSFQVRDNLTVLQRVSLNPGTTVPWGDNLTITVTYYNMDNGSSPISGAIIYCDWDEFYWSYSYNATHQAYIIVIRTESRNEGSYTLNITAAKEHYQTFMIIENFVLREIQTNLVVDPSYIPNWPLGFNLTMRVDFYDMDHGGQIPYSEVYTDWNESYYQIIYYGNGTYDLILNTTCRGIATHSINITLWRQHYAQRTVLVSLTLVPIPLFVEVISTSPITTEYNSTDQVVVTVRVTDLYNRLINDSITTYHWVGGNGTLVFMGAGVYNVSFLAGADTGAYVVTIQANKTSYQLGVGYVLLNILPTDTTLTPLVTNIQAIVGADFDISVIFTTIHGTGIADANVTYLWATNRTGELTFVGGNMYNGTLSSSDLIAGQYIIYVTAGGRNVIERTTTISVFLLLIPTALQAYPAIQDIYYGGEFNLQVYFNDTLNNLPLDGANITYYWGDLSGSLQPTGVSGWYNVSLSSTIFPVGTYTVTLSADLLSYQFALESVAVIIRTQPTQLELIQIQSYYEPGDILVNLTGTTWDVPRGEILRLYFNFTDAVNNTISTATGAYSWAYGSGVLEYIDGLYVATINLTQASPGIYFLGVTLTLQNYEIGQSPTYQLNVMRVPTAVQVTSDIVQVTTGTSWVLTVYFNDTYHNLPIIGGNLTITIPQLGLENVLMIDNLDGTYSYLIPAMFFESTLLIEIKALGGLQYTTATEEVAVLVSLHPMTRNTIQIGLIAAVIGIILLLIWFAYNRVFSIPWLVRKMRKMSKTIGKGKTPGLSKRDISRISTRPDQMSHIIEPSYEGAQIPVTAAVIPAVIKWDEREAEEEAIWEELKALPVLEHAQKVELFQEMKRIPPSERIWFLEDLKRQMADGTRFARRRKKPKKAKLSPKLEEEIQLRLATFPALSKMEKERVAAQLRELPKEEWDEIFQTFAKAPSPPKFEEERTRPDEFPELTPEERKRVLAELRDLSEEEREKVMKTLREKKSKTPPQKKIMKGKKEFVVDEDDETG